MGLGWFQRRRLVRDGYLQLRGLVPRGPLDAALAVINRSLGERGLPPDRLGEMRARTFCPELVSAPEILALYTHTRALAEAALGRVRPPQEGQIALRFPAGQPRAVVPHIDGMYTPDNGVPAGTLMHFTALLGVFLSDVTGPDAGNFTVWPGSHRVLEAHFRAHGTAAISARFPSLAPTSPRPLLGRAGDVILAHYALAHAASVNLGPHVRYAVFFRLYHPDHEQAGTRPLTELWSEWEGLR
jgi:Phytanoyl-CoA dioxygenase (PhyH)